MNILMFIYIYIYVLIFFTGLKYILFVKNCQNSFVTKRVSICVSSHRMDSTREASSSRPAKEATARAAGGGRPVVTGLTIGGRKQARVRARKTKQLRRTSRKELKVELANVCTWTWFSTWREQEIWNWDKVVSQKSCLHLTLHTCTYFS